MTETIEGYVLTLYERIPGKAVLVDPLDTSQQLDEGFQPKDIQAVLLESPDVLRQFTMEQLVQLATQFPERGKALLLKRGEVERCGLRPMHLVTAEQSDGGLAVTSVEGLTEPKAVKALPYYGEFRLEEMFATERIAIERLKEVADNPPEDIKEAQLQDIRKGGLQLMQLLSYFAPLLKGAFLFDSGPEKGGKSFATRMVFYFVRWILVKEEPNTHVVFLAVGERGGELGEFRRLSRGHQRVEFFGTSMDDLPPRKWVYTAWAALERVKRLLELGKDVFFFADSLSRLAEGLSLSAPRDEAHVTGGHALSAMVQPRAFLGVAGVYPEHPARPTATVFVTGLKESTPFHDAPAAQMGGTSDADWSYTRKAHSHPKLSVVNGATSSRGLSWVDLTELERWFTDELHERVTIHANGGGRFNPQAGLDWLVSTFENATPQEVMERWDRVRRKNALFTAFQMGNDQTRVAIDELNLTFEQVQQLVNARLELQLNTLADDLVELFDAGCNIHGFLAGEAAALELYQQLAYHRREWSNAGYTEVVGKETTLSNLACDPLREAKIPASLVKEFVAEGHDFSKIIEAARRGAGPDDVREYLKGTETLGE